MVNNTDHYIQINFCCVFTFVKDICPNQRFNCKVLEHKTGEHINCSITCPFIVNNSEFNTSGDNT
jgi:hypothetical protein